MGISKNNKERREVFAGHLGIDLSDWRQVFSACLGKMMAIQNACGELVVKNQDWNVDFDTNSIAFGDDEYPMQFIGSESDNDNTWLWGWENVNGFSDSAIEIANYAKEIGDKWKLEPLSTASFELDDVYNGHFMSIVACGTFPRRYCYYRCPHDGGTVFVALSNVPDEVFAPISGSEFSSLTTQCIQQFDIDHKIFVEGFLLWNGTAYEVDGNKLIARFEQDLHIEFEQAGESLRIKSIDMR